MGPAIPTPPPLTGGKRIVAVFEITGNQGSAPEYRLVEVRVDVPKGKLTGSSVIRPVSPPVHLPVLQTPTPPTNHRMALWQAEIVAGYTAHRLTRTKHGLSVWPLHAGGRDDAIVLSPEVLKPPAKKARGADEVLWRNSSAFDVYLEIMKDPDVNPTVDPDSPFTQNPGVNRVNTIETNKMFASGPVYTPTSPGTRYFKARAWFAGGPAVDPHIIVH